MKKKISNIRIGIIGLMVFFAFLTVSFNVFRVAISGIHSYSGKDITQYTSKSNTVTETKVARRGYIFDRNGNVIAQDSDTYTIYAVLSSSRPSAGKPAYVTDVPYTAEILAPILKTDKETLIQYMSKDKYQVEFGSVGRGLTLAQKEEIESYDLPGIEFIKTTSRIYPLGIFSSHLIGYAQYDEEADGLSGKMGIESYYNEELSGENGYSKYQVSSEGFSLPGSLKEEQEAVYGSDIYLTLDRGIQEQLEMSLNETMETQNADKAWGAVMETDTGKILAWGGYPTFDPAIKEIEDYTNIGTQFAYEPGSTMKTFTYAAAIDSGVYDEDATFNSNTFYMGIKNGEAIRVSSSDNWIEKVTNARNKSWGNISYDLGFRYSSNVGIASLLTNYLDPSVFESYLNEFGFFQKVEMDRINDVTGKKVFRYPIEKIALGYGQGSSVTMLQLLQAYSAIFNDGTMVKPYVVQQIKNSNTQEIEYLADTTVVNQPIKKSTAEYMQQLMYDVVNTEDGSGKRYRVNEVDVIAKTGTAQVYYEGSYNTGKVITSVAIGFPADNPKIMVYYAFQSDYNEYLHSNTQPVTKLIQKAAVNTGYTKSSMDIDNEEDIYHDTKTYIMDNLVNHTLSYAENKLKDMDVEIVLLGNGQHIIKQYPQENALVISDQKVFLLTDDPQIAMPDIIGYSRKEVMALWKLCDIAVAISGEGKVVSQSIVENTLLYPNSFLEVVLE